MAEIRCHYDVLDVPRDADAATIKKSHRRKALRHHPDKTVGHTEEEQAQSAIEFKLIQAAYECLSDPQERKWYDEHRDMILRGGLNGGADEGDGSSFMYDVTPFHNAGCYDGFDDDDPESFYSVYDEAFKGIWGGEQDGYISEGNIDTEKMSNFHLSEVEFGDSTSNWEDILAFYNTWEGFTSCLSFAWVDVYQLNDIREAPGRRVRRLMEDDNKKKRKAAKRERMEDIWALIRFVKKRDPRVKAQREKSARDQAEKEAKMKRDAAQRKKDIAAAKEEWRAEAERAMAEQETADLSMGRFRLADDEDDYDYGGGRKKKGRRKGKGGKKNPIDNEDSGTCEIIDPDSTNVDQDAIIKDDNDAEDEKKVETSEAPLADEDMKDAEDEEKVDTGELPLADDDIKEEDINSDAIADAVADDLCDGMDDLEVLSLSSSSSEESEEEPDFWRCECCRKEFKSDKQLENHERSKKHKEAFKKYEKKMKKEAKKKALEDMMNELDDEEEMDFEEE